MKKNDIILILVVLILAGGTFLWMSLSGGETGAKAFVYVDGEVQATYDLKTEGEFEIVTDQGKNILVIRDGEADMTEADCPDGLCVKQHAISKTGETIVCLPHKVVIEVEGAQESELDAITR